MAVNFDVVLRVFQLTHNMAFGERAALSSRMDELVHETFVPGVSTPTTPYGGLSYATMML
jgi:hypothetical protein